MLIHELSSAECRQILLRTAVGRIACSRADQPYIVPISFAYDRAFDCLFSFSSLGKKIEWMRDNPKVCVEVETVEDRFHWTTLVIFGRYVEISDSPEDRVVRTRALHLLERHEEWWLPGAAKLKAEERSAVVVYRVNIESVSGRRASRDRTPE
jgi:uncharacterized protein